MKTLLDYLNDRVKDYRLGVVDLPVPEHPPVDLCFFCEATLEKHEPDCPVLRLPTNAPTSAKEKHQ